MISGIAKLMKPQVQTNSDFPRLAWTVAGVGLAILPHFSHLPLWITVFVITIAAWRLLAEWIGWPLPPRMLRILVVLTGFLGILVTYRTVYGLNGGTALLVIMMGMKLMETRSRRDQLVLLVISYFLILASFLYDQHIWKTVYVLGIVWLITSAILQTSKPGKTRPTRETLRLSGAMLAQAVPIMIVLFVLFPRLPGPLWGVPGQNSATTGLGTEMSPGRISELSQSGAVAFRVRFEGDMPPPVERYWRGPIMHAFDGLTWRQHEMPNRGKFEDIEFLGEPVRYRVSLEPHGLRMVFALEMPNKFTDISPYMRDDYQPRVRRRVNRLLNYGVESHTRFRMDIELDEFHRNAYTRLPTNRNSRSRELALSLRQQTRNDEELIQRVLRMFREQEFFYTLQPPSLSRNSVDDFLFETRRGFCGHYASAFTSLMRAAGIPARVVTGYQGGEYNPIGDYLIVRQSDAHAWSEVWLQGRGWLRVDPTAAVAPERIERGLASSVADGEPVPGLFFANYPFLNRLRLTWDAAHTLWNDFFIDFDSQTQRMLLENLGISKPGWSSLVLLLTIMISSSMALLSVYLARQFRPKKVDPAVRLYAKFCQKMKRYSLIRGDNEGPLDFAQRIANQNPELAAYAMRVTMQYVRMRYEDERNLNTTRDLRQMIAAFPPKL
jgi:transglutaminase-like putative cysteine protease